MVPKTGDVVVLVPGFLGFERIDEFYYFADRVTVALRSALEATLGPSVPVIPLSTKPTEPLQVRQRHLLNKLNVLAEGPDRVERLHLVGHSTGGVDAELLLRERPLSDSEWASLDPRGLRNKIRTVVTLGSPFFGTALAEASIARLLAEPQSNLGVLLELPLLGLEAVRSMWDDPALIAAALGFRRDASEVDRFVRSVFRSRALVDELTPRGMETIRDRAGDRVLKDVRVRCFVTMAAERTVSYVGGAGKAGERRPDDFFGYLYARTAHHGDWCGERTETRDKVEKALERILLKKRALEHDVIKNRLACLYDEVDLALNDGVVNSARQVAEPTNEMDLADIVVADHVDVIGHYPRWLGDSGRTYLDRPINTNVGFLHSGSGFGDAQFFQLMVRIAEEIASNGRRSTRTSTGAEVVPAAG